MNTRYLNAAGYENRAEKNTVDNVIRSHNECLNRSDTFKFSHKGE
jgi:hypothetical protein